MKAIEHFVIHFPQEPFQNRNTIVAVFWTSAKHDIPADFCYYLTDKHRSTRGFHATTHNQTRDQYINMKIIYLNVILTLLISIFALTFIYF